MLIFPLAINAGVADDLKNQIQQKQDRIKKLEQQALEYQQTIKQKQGEAQTLKNRISLYEAEIERLDIEVQLTELKIEELNLQIQSTADDIANQETEIEKNKIKIAETIRSINDYDETNFLELILKTNDISEFINQAGYMEMLQGEIQERVMEIQELKKQLEEKKLELNDQRGRQEILRGDLEGDRSTQSQQKQEQQYLLSKTRQSEIKYKELLSDVEIKQRDTEQEIYALEEELRRALDPSKIPPARPGILSWPTEGLITQGYGCIENNFARRLYPDCNNGKGGFHNGTDIAAAPGTKIFAARDGKVIASGEAPYAYGNWIAIEHDNGLVTLYTHLSKKKVGVGDSVLREQTLVGYMGSSGLSTGSHLHFTVYAPGTFRTQPSKLAGILPIGAPLNPMDYL